MASDNILYKFKKGGICLLFLYAYGCIAQEKNNISLLGDPQVEFNRGVKLMFEGEGSSAAVLFKKLFEQTGSIRVKLEWARAAFISHEYDLAQKLFDEVLSESIPESVRFNIGLYKAELSKIATNNDYGFGISKDTNPFSLSQPQEVYIYGLPFRFQPPIKRESLLGLNFYFTKNTSLFNSNDIRAIIGVEATQYEGTNNNKYSFHSAIDYRIPDFKSVSIRAGINPTYQRDARVMDHSYINFQHRMDYAFGPLNTTQIDLKIGKNNYPLSPQADSNSKSLSFSTVKNFSGTTQLGGSFYIDSSRANFESISFKTYSASLFLKKYVESISSTFQANILTAHRFYVGSDELFGIRRVDLRNVASVSVSNNLKIIGLYPAIELGVEKFDSNISINSYNRIFFNATLKKFFN